jgi:uncharacterized protein YhbP (UPF0306 family)
MKWLTLVKTDEGDGAMLVVKDGETRPMQPLDLKEVAARDARIQQLERLNAQLAVQVDRQTKVIDAVQALAEAQMLQGSFGPRISDLYEALRTYNAQMAQLAKEGR